MKSANEYELIMINQNKNFNLALDEIVNIYPSYKIFNEENIQSQFLSDVSHLEKIKSEIFLTMNRLRIDNDSINKSIFTLNRDINILNGKNKRLQIISDNLENQGDAAKGELNMLKEINDIKFVENIIILILALFAIYFLFNKKISNSISNLDVNSKINDNQQ